MIKMNGTTSKQALFSLALIALPLLSACNGEGLGKRSATVAESGGDPVKGPHGGRLLAERDLQIEVTIYESGVAPEFRVYVHQGDEKIAPEEVQLTIDLHRLG
ncbi:MAG: HlyD family secretion protein, partial [Thermoanaerobaculia bacterium]